MTIKERYINPFTDFGFKKLFGSEFNKEHLVDFLNQVLGEREHIQELTYFNTEIQGRTLADRKAVFDLFCENERGEKFIIELQNEPVPAQGQAQGIAGEGIRAAVLGSGDRQINPYRDENVR